MTIVINDNRKNVIKGAIDKTKSNETIYATILDILSTVGYEITTEDKKYILSLGYVLDDFKNE